MKVHYTHRKTFQQIKNTFECLSTVFLISGGIVILYSLPTIQSVQNIIWTVEFSKWAKLLIGIGVILKALKFFLEAIFKRKIYDWSYVYPELAGYRMLSDKKSIKGELDGKPEQDAFYEKFKLDGYLKNLIKIDAIGQKILKLKSEIDNLTKS